MQSRSKYAVWVWYCDLPQGGYLFRGNPNPPSKTPPYHLNSVFGLVHGEQIVWAETRKTLEAELGVDEWNMKFPQFRVKPKSVLIDIRPYYIRKKGGAK